MKRILPFILVLFLVTACASGADTASMTVGKVGSDDFHLKNSVFLSSLTGGRETNPLWASKVGNEEFKAALISSLKANDIYNNNDPKYDLSVNLETLDQPMIGMSLKVVSVTNVTLMDKNAENPVLSQKIQADYTAKMLDHLVANKRLKLANEGSIRENIKKIILLLKDYKE